eukprot:906753-Rhodomonas_salina.1
MEREREDVLHRAPDLVLEGGFGHGDEERVARVAGLPLKPKEGRGANEGQKKRNGGRQEETEIGKKGRRFGGQWLRRGKGRREGGVVRREGKERGARGWSREEMTGERGRERGRGGRRKGRREGGREAGRERGKKGRGEYGGEGESGGPLGRGGGGGGGGGGGVGVRLRVQRLSQVQHRVVLAVWGEAQADARL